MEDWEDETLPLSSKTERAKTRWDDEDEEQNDVRESWEDEDEPTIPELENKSMKNITLTPVAEEHQQERLVDEADFLSQNDVSVEKNDEKSLENFIPKSESDFLQYADLISHELHLYENSFHYIGLLKAVMRLSITALNAGDAKEVASSVAAIANEKLKLEKQTNKTKIVAKMKQLHVEKESDNAIVDAYDDYAFM